MPLIAAATDVRPVIPGAIAGDDAVIDVLIAQASIAFAEWLGFPPASIGADPTLEESTYTRRSGFGIFVDDVYPWRLVLEPFPIIAMADVREDDRHTFAASSVVASSNYEQLGDRGQIIELLPGSGHGSFATERGSVRATFTAGFASGNIPGSLKLALVEYSAILFLEFKRRGTKSATEGSLTTSFQAPGIPAYIKALISPYRMPSSYA